MIKILYQSVEAKNRARLIEYMAAIDTLIGCNEVCIAETPCRIAATVVDESSTGKYWRQ